MPRMGFANDTARKAVDSFGRVADRVSEYHVPGGLHRPASAQTRSAADGGSRRIASAVTDMPHTWPLLNTLAPVSDLPKNVDLTLRHFDVLADNFWGETNRRAEPIKEAWLLICERDGEGECRMVSDGDNGGVG